MYRIWANIVGVLFLCVLHFIIAPIALLHRNFARQYPLKWACRVLLWALGIRINEVSRPKEFPNAAVYIANHCSTLDVLVYNAIGIPRCAFFLTGYHWVVAPIFLPAWALGTYFTASQEQTTRRREIFSDAAKSLRKNGDNVMLTPEGQRYIDGTIGRFNKGAFHLAISLERPIVPFFIHIDQKINPGLGYKVRPGTVHVYWGQAVANLPKEFDGARFWPDRFQNWYREFNQFLATGEAVSDSQNPFANLNPRMLKAKRSRSSSMRQTKPTDSESNGPELF